MILGHGLQLFSLPLIPFLLLLILLPPLPFLLLFSLALLVSLLHLQQLHHPRNLLPRVIALQPIQYQQFYQKTETAAWLDHALKGTQLNTTNSAGTSLHTIQTFDTALWHIAGTAKSIWCIQVIELQKSLDGLVWLRDSMFYLYGINQHFTNIRRSLMFHLQKDLQQGLSAFHLFRQRREKVPVPELTFTFHLALYRAKDIYQAPSCCFDLK